MPNHYPELYPPEEKMFMIAFPSFILSAVFFLDFDLLFEFCCLNEINRVQACRAIYCIIQNKAI